MENIETLEKKKISEGIEISEESEISKGAEILQETEGTEILQETEGTEILQETEGTEVLQGAEGTEISGTTGIGTIVSLINEHSDFCLFTHNSMDGDTLGSALALAFALEKMGKSQRILISESIPGKLSILPISRSVSDISEVDADFCAEGRIAVAIDTADPAMFGNRLDFFRKFGFSINIDHHITNKRYCDVNLVESAAAATAEIIYRIIKELGVEMDKSIAECLYAGICTDTGGFRYKNTTSSSHLISAELLKYDLDVDHMHFCFFEANTLSKIKIRGYVAHAMNFYYDGKLSIAIIPLEIFQRYGGSDEDSDGLVNIGRSVLGVEISILAREIKKDFFKVNFRSTRDADVSRIAAKFGGGGHRAAAGCSLNAEVNEVERLLVESVETDVFISTESKSEAESEAISESESKSASESESKSEADTHADKRRL